MNTLTVFTPTYNRAHTLPRTYESLCRQSCKDFDWLVVDDGSTDNTRELVEAWVEEGIISIRYIYKENGGLYTGYNTAYLNIETELNVCVDSDDFMPDNAVATIINYWRQFGSDKYAGLLGLDFLLQTGEPIGGYFPKDLKETHFIDLYLKKLHMGDTKPVYRSVLTRSVAPMTGFEGEKNFNPVYMALQIDNDYPLLVINENLCIVDYQENDSMSKGIFRQYFNSPKSFSKLRRLEMTLKHNTLKNKLRVCTHYVATSIIARNWKYIIESPMPLTTVLMTPLGVALYFYMKSKA
jgi:glycosyltransferase involved in cell wall biosynthesis